MVEEGKRVTAEKRYWSAVRSLNAGNDDPAALRTIVELASATGLGSVSEWAQQTLAAKTGCALVLSS